MEPRPPDLHEHEAPESAEKPRGNWVEEVLGEDWRTDGDGIYRYVPGPDATSRARPTQEPVALTWTLDCGHEVSVLPEERPDVPPPRPRMCLKCGKLRKVIVEP